MTQETEFTNAGFVVSQVVKMTGFFNESENLLYRQNFADAN